MSVTNIKASQLEVSKKVAIESALEGIEHFVKGIECYIRCGNALIEVKAELPYGEFIPWIKESMPVGRTQCTKYIRLATYSNVHSSEHLEGLSINESIEKIKELEAPKPKPPKDIAPPPYTPPKDEVYVPPSTTPPREAVIYKIDGVVVTKEQYDNDSYEPDITVVWNTEDEEEEYDIFKEVNESFDKLITSSIDNNSGTKMNNILLEAGEELQKKVFKVMKQYLHPDKDTGNEKLFKQLMDLEGDFK